MNNKQVFLLLTNKFTQSIVTQFENLSNEAASLGDAYIIYHNNANVTSNEWKHFNHCTFSDKILTELNYEAIFNRLLPGSNHFPLLHFFLKNPCYDYYWYIEDDVRYNGEWKKLFCAFPASQKIDFISCHIKTFYEEPMWNWWHTLSHPYCFIPNRLKIRSFNPIYRISNLALQHIHQILTDKWQGHHEVLLPTLLYLSGYSVVDFGGTGKFVLEGYENRFYKSKFFDIYGNLDTGTMRFRPVLQDMEMRECKLYHPVKGY